MANSLLKLTVESSEYDAKLKKAAEGVRHLADVAHKSAGDMTGLEQSTLDYIKSIGEMETKSRSAAGQVRELESTYKELKVIYDQLNDVEKADEGGKALAASLEQLRQRAQDAKKSLDDASRSLQGNEEACQQDSMSIGDLTSKLGINVKSLVSWGAALGAGKVALDVLKDAFFNNEEQLDEWGRICESSESLYNGFLNALNTGDISGYLENIGRITEAARAAYDALDELATFNAFNQINVEKTHTQMTESMVDYREGNATKDDVKAAGEAYKKELKERKRLEKDAYIEAVGKVAAERGVSKQDLLDALSGNYGHYQDLKKVMPTGEKTEYVPGTMPGTKGTYRVYKVAQNDQERLGEALRHLNDTELESLQALGAQAERTGNEIASVDRQLSRILNGKGDTQKPTKPTNKETFVEGEIGAYEQAISELRKAEKHISSNEAWDELQHRIGELIIKVKELKGELKVVPASVTDSLNAATDAQNKKTQDRLNDPNTVSKGMADVVKRMERDQKKDDKQQKFFMDGFAKLTSGISGMASGFEALGIDLGKDFKEVIGGIQGITSILTAISTIVSAIEVIAGADALIPFAGGGIVPKAAGGRFIGGNSFSGDNVFAGNAWVNSGELVLNRAEQGNLAAQLTGDGAGGYIPSHISGEQIWVVLNRHTKRKGMGEIVTWK